MSDVTPEILTAYHEAGHAVVAMLLGRPVQRVSIEPRATRLGQCQLKRGRSKPSQDPLEVEVLILLAGLAAEARRSGHYALDGARQDLLQARSLTRMRSANERQAERLERRLLDKVEHLLAGEGAWIAVEQIADALLRHGEISGRAAHHLFERAAEEA